MAEQARISSDVLRADSTGECGQPVGQLNIALRGGTQSFETVSFYCTQPKLHLGRCAFIGKELMVLRRDR